MKRGLKPATPRTHKTVRVLISNPDETPLDQPTLTRVRQLLGCGAYSTEQGCRFAAYTAVLPPADFASAIAAMIYDYALDVTIAH